MLRSATIAVLLLASLLASAEELSVAAAADLNFALNEIATKYQRDTGNTLKISYGSSGNFFTQIQNGAPFDVFLSADLDYPRKLEAAGLVEPGTLYVYASGCLVLWVPKSSKIDLSRGMDALLDPSVKKIAIANPAHAPYGRAAEAALRKAGLHERLKAKLVLGENVSQTAQFVDSGNADIGIIAYSIALAPTMKSRGRAHQVPIDLYPHLQQAGVVLKRSSQKRAAMEFINYLKRSDIQEKLRTYGFSTPVNPPE